MNQKDIDDRIKIFKDILSLDPCLISQQISMNEVFMPRKSKLAFEAAYTCGMQIQEVKTGGYLFTAA